MSIRSYSSSDSSSEETKFYIPVYNCFLREREYKNWRLCEGSSDLMTTASAILSQISNPTSEGDMSNQTSFLYDYYGMTEETRQEPPSPGHSPVTSESDADREHNRSISEVIDIPIKENSSPLETRHSFPETGKSQISTVFVTQSGETLTKRHHTSSLQSVAKEEISSSHLPVASEIEHGQRMDFSRHLLGEERYRYTLEAQTSLVQKRGEDSLTYLNKGQFYFFTLQAFGAKLSRVRSVIHLVFRNEKDPNTEIMHWKYWYNQQPNPNQRAIDIDLKACQNILDVEEVGYNALSLYWDPTIGSKVSLRINCLSTDFSPQKGVKGIPLHVQVDTFEDYNSETADPVHRAFCQIKVFRDKGAERKNKDESKTVTKRMVKYLKSSDGGGSDISHVFQDAYKVTILYPTTNLGTKSVIFVPEREKERTKSTDSAPGAGSFLSQIRERENKRGFNVALSNAKDDLEQLDVLPRIKNPRVLPKKQPAATIYVRKEEEKAYNALMLETLSLSELKLAISRKYGVPEEMIKQIFKKTKKGILVYLDDQLVEQFADEDDFIISINFDNQLGNFEVVFNC